MLLLVSATRFEVQPTLAGLSFLHHPQFGEYLWISRAYPQIGVCVTGVGAPATALFLGRLLSDLNVTGLLNVGVAGSFNRNLPLGSLVQINEAIFGDLGAEAADGHFLDLAELGLSQSPGETAAIHNRLSATPDWLRTSFPSVIDLTVNIVTGTAQTEASRMARWRADTESMETAAVFLAAQSLGLPVAAVRAISNYTGPRNKAKWEIQTAIRNLNEWLSACIERRQLP